MIRARYVLVHSPVVGPGTWLPVAECLAARGIALSVPSMLGFHEGPRPYWQRFVALAAEAVPRGDEPVVLVGHSGAGALLPLIARELQPRVAAFVFVDATIPAASGASHLVPPGLQQGLRSLAADGHLPPWSEWFGPDALASLVPDEDVLRGVVAELPRLPVDYVEETAPLVAGWPDAPCGYLRFSDVYEPVEAEAAARGFQLRRVPGNHLHLLVEPDAVAACIQTLVTELLRVAPTGR